MITVAKKTVVRPEHRPVGRFGDLATRPVFLAALVLLSACTTTAPRRYDHTASTAISTSEDTELGRFFAPEIAANPGESGVAMVSTSEWGFRARAGMANMAEQTLDLQYYIWEVDSVGKILAERLLRAADRGVRVRMLLDDINTADSDFKFARLDWHPNIEIRLFNPFARRQSRISELLFNLDRLNYRMHNKAWIADNAIAIVGGRNIGDDYFGVDTIANFRDLDLGLAGPAVQEVSASFDSFWNSKWAIPVSELVGGDTDLEQFQTRKLALYDWVENIQDFPYPIDTTSDALFTHLEELRDSFVWTKVRIIHDDPDKLETGEEEVVDELRAAGQDKEHEILLEVAYLVPGPRELENARRNHEQGIYQRILTNSLATNDVAAAHAGYAKYRPELIRSGVDIYELRPDASYERKEWSLLAGKSKASLHTKAFLQDREKVTIGSFNLDPRSIAINTELVILFENAELAAQIGDYMDTGVLPRNSYHVILEPDEETGIERLVWITEQDGEEVRYYSEPEAGFWQSFSAWFMSFLPIDKHL